MGEKKLHSGAVCTAKSGGNMPPLSAHDLSRCKVLYQRWTVLCGRDNR